MSTESQLDADPETEGTPRANNRKRNLVNQRNFRARRKEYIEELEAKVHDYEKQGIAAAQQMQDAARQKIAENDILRQIISTHVGWSAEDIDAVVQQSLGMRLPKKQQQGLQVDMKVNGNGFGGSNGSSVPNRMDVDMAGARDRQNGARSPSEEARRMHYVESASHSELPPYHARAHVRHTDDWMMLDRPTDNGFSKTSSSPPLLLDNKPQATPSLFNETNHVLPPPREISRHAGMPLLIHTKEEFVPPKPAVMSCDDAASILAELAGGQGGSGNSNGHSVETIRNELGCKSADTCDVSHQDVFERMARKI